MGTIAASVILNRAAKTLLDETGVVWNPAELLDYLNAGITAIVAAKPDAFTVNAPFPLVAGTKQSIPASGIQILDVIRNLGAGGATPGGVIRQAERTALDHADPQWHTATGTEVLHFMTDRRDPRVFYVYPARTSLPWSVELLYASHPPRISAPNEILPIDDLYESPLHAYVCGYAYAKNTKRQDVGKMNGYMTMFANSIGVKSQVQFAFAPTPADLSDPQDR